MVTSCINLFHVIVSELNLSGGDIVGQTWDWFVQASEVSIEPPVSIASPQNSGPNRRASQIRQPLQKQGVPSELGKSLSLNANKKRSPSPKKSKQAPPPKEVPEVNEFIELIQKPGLHAVVAAFLAFDEAKEGASYLMLHFGKFNAVELFTEKLQDLLP